MVGTPSTHRADVSLVGFDPLHLGGLRNQTVASLQSLRLVFILLLQRGGAGEVGGLEWRDELVVSLKASCFNTQTWL